METLKVSSILILPLPGITAWVLIAPQTAPVFGRCQGQVPNVGKLPTGSMCRCMSLLTRL
jgi:hypothetical protein